MHRTKTGLFTALGLAVLLLVSCAQELTDIQHLQNAKDFLDEGDLKGGMIELKNALQKNPRNAEARWVLGDIYINFGLGEFAEKELRRAEEYGVSHNAIVTSLAQAMILQKHYKELLAEINIDGIQDKETISNIHAFRAEALMGLADMENARIEINRANSIFPEGQFARLETARLRIMERKNDEAREILKGLTEEHNGFEHGWKLLGDLESLENHLIEAEAAYTKAIDNSYQNNLVRMRRAFLRLVLKDLEGAEKDIKTLEKLVPEHYKVLFAKGVLLLQKGKLDDAISTLQESSRKNPAHIPTIYYLGLANFAKGNLQQAENSINQLVFQYPGYMDARVLLARIRLASKNFKGAVDILNPVLLSNPDDISLLLLMGYAEIGQGNREEGLAHIKKVAQMNPDQLLSRTQYGLALMESGDTENGLKELEAALKLQPGNQDIQAILLGSMLKSGKYEEVLQKTTEITAESGESAQTYNAIGVAHLSKGNINDARKAFEKALDIEPANPDVSSNLAQIEIQSGNHDKARFLLKNVIVKNRNHHDTWIKLARLELSQGNIIEGKKLLQEAATLFPKSPEVISMLARLSVRFGQPEQAISLVKNIIEDNKENQFLLEVLGEAQLEINQPRNAIITLEKLVAINPNIPVHHYLLAKGYLSLNELKRAKQELSMALKLEPDNLLANITLARLYVIEGNTEQAQPVIGKLQKLYPDRAEVNGLVGWLSTRQGNYEQAISAYESALKIFESSEWTVSLATACWRTGNEAKGMDVLTSWLQKYPDDFRARFTLADFYVQKDRQESAKNEFSILIKAQPSNLVVLNNLAWLLLKTEPEQALRYAEQAASLQPDSVEIQDTLGLALLAQGQVERALRIFNDISIKAPENLSIKFHLANAYVKNGQKAKAKAILQNILAKPDHFPEKMEADALLKSM